MGFSTVVLGLPSVPFAVDVVHRLLLGSHHVRDFDRPVHGADFLRDHIEVDEPALAVPNVSFTRREMELLDLLHRGMQNKLIAYELGISQSTVKAHLRSIMMKLNAKNRTQAIGMLTREIGHRAWAIMLAGSILGLAVLPCISASAAEAGMKEPAHAARPANLSQSSLIFNPSAKAPSLERFQPAQDWLDHTVARRS